MRPGISITLTAPDRRRLEAIIRNRNAPQKHVWRAEIVLLSADDHGTVEIMRRTQKSKTCVWRWQERFAEEGVDGLLRLIGRAMAAGVSCEYFGTEGYRLHSLPEVVARAGIGASNPES